MYPAGALPDRALADNWTWDFFLAAAEKCFKAATRSACRSGPRLSVNGVEFTMSQNSTVTCFISPGSMPLAVPTGAG
jgi:hypothetical protein